MPPATHPAQAPPESRRPLDGPPRSGRPGSRPGPADDDDRAGRPPTRRPEPWRPPEPPPEPTPEEVRAAARPVRQVGFLSMIAFAMTAFLPLPWQLGGPVLAVVALVLGVRALRIVLASGLRRAFAAPLVVAMAFSGLVLLTSSSVIATWPVQMRHQECLERAITVSARDACEAEYRDAIDSYLNPSGAATP